MEQKLKLLIGELHFVVVGLQHQNEELQKKIVELEGNKMANDNKKEGVPSQT